MLLLKREDSTKFFFMFLGSSLKVVVNASINSCIPWVGH